MFLAHRNLFKDKTRLALSIGGVALAVMLILLLNGFLSGMNRQITSYLDHTPGLLVVAQSGVSNLLGATSLLPPGAAEVENVEGVAKVAPILSQFVILDLHGKKQPAYLVGYLPEKGGGPWQIAEGRAPEADDEVVFDRVLAERHNMRLGDSFEIMGRDFTVVGLSEGTASWMTSFIFIRKTAAESLLRAPGATSFLLVTPAQDESVEAVRDRLSDLPGAHALLKTEMTTNDLKLFARIFSAPLRLMVGIAFLVGTLVVGLVIYTATVERQREYGVLKAIGARNGHLYRAVLAQALLSVALGFGLGWVVTLLLSAIVPRLSLNLALQVSGESLVKVAGVSLVIAALAAVLPIKQIAGLDPALVFRGK